jgi:thioredoxin 1
MAIEVGKDNYEEEVLKSKLPVLVDFWGPQCNRCLALMPAVDELEVKFAGKVKVAKLNAAAGNRMLCARLKVLGLPAFLFYKSGVEVKRLTGEQVTAREIEESIQLILS